jgi:two-component system response regulator
MTKAILLVEDEDHDVFFMQLALEEAGANNPLSVARDGREAIAYLKGEDKFASRHDFPLPGLVLLDLRLPRVPGLQVLKWIREQPGFMKLPVIICSSSSQDSDVDTAYRLGANGYLVKPSHTADRLALVRLIKKYWLDLDGPPPDCKEWLSANVPALTPHREAS